MSDDGKIIPIGRKAKGRGRTVTVGGSADRTALSLTIYCGDIDPDQITKQLGVEPTETHRKGERRKQRYRAYTQSAWFLSLEATAPRGLEELLHDLLRRLPPSTSAVWSNLRAAYDVQLRIGLFLNEWNRGFVVHSNLVAQAAHIANKFDFDIYGVGGV